MTDPDAFSLLEDAARMNPDLKSAGKLVRDAIERGRYLAAENAVMRDTIKVQAKVIMRAHAERERIAELMRKELQK
jgi:hypothetical protein